VSEPGAAAIESKVCAGLVRRGVFSIDEVRQLIQISPTDEKYLRKHFDEAKVTEAIRDRQEILRRFEQQLSSPTPIIERTKPRPRARRRNGRHCRKPAETGWRQAGSISPAR
jgi:hypothetical protein